MPDSTADSDAPAPPDLVAPADAVVAHGRNVTFAWEVSSGADRYRLQIAETARFDDLVVDANVGNETAVTVGNQLPTDGETFFWRVRAGSEEGWSAPSSVESFIASTEEEAEHDLLSEPVAGPVTGLARARTRDVSREVLTIDDRLEQEKERGVAYEGVAASQIMGIAAAILIVILVAVVVIFGWYGQVVQETRADLTNDQNYELLQETRTEANDALSQYGVVDKEEGVYRIPIDRAMDIVAREEYEASQSGAASPAPESE